MRVLKETTALGLVLGLAAGAWAQSGAVDRTPPVEPADRGTRLDVTPTGTPIVNIAKPRNGTSYNVFKRFNVATEGLILNNSTAIGTSVLGGELLANPNLKGGPSASLIINEVLGGSRSDLRGAIEVFGPAAGVILANPDGITCDGCGFINAPRVSLTTGTIVFGAEGALSGFAVEGGDVAIEGEGLLAGNVDFFDIVTASAAINASLYARDLVVAGGASDFDAATRTAAARAGGNDRLAIDSSLLGGMYANRIRLIGTGDGVGINLKGTTAALDGALEITAGGDIAVRSAAAAADMALRSTGGSIKVDERLYAGGSLSLEARGDVSHAGDFIGAAGDVSIASRDGGVSLGGRGVYAGLDGDGRLDGSGGIRVDAAGALDVSADIQLIATGDVALTGDRVRLAARSNVLGDGIDVVAGEELVAAGTIGSRGDMALRGRVLDLVGDVAADGRLALEAARIDLAGTAIGLAGVTAETEDELTIIAGGSLQTNGELAVAAGEVDVRGRVVGGAGVAIEVDGGLENSGELLSGRDLALTVGGDARLDGTIAAGGRIDAASGGAMTVAGKLVSTGDLSLQAADLRIGRSALSGGDLSLSGDRIETATGSTVAANGTVRASATNAARFAGSVSAGGDVALGSSGGLDVAGVVAAAGAIDAEASDVSITGSLVADGRVAVAADGLARVDGTISAGERLKLLGSEIVVGEVGRVVSDGAVDLAAAVRLLNAGVVGGDVLTLSSGGTLANTGALVGTSSLSVEAATLLNTGLLGSNGRLALQADTVALASTSEVQAGGALRIAAADRLETEGTITAGAADLSGGAALLQRADLRVGGVASLATRGLLTQDGSFIAGGSISLRAERLVGIGATATNGDLVADTGAGGIDYDGSLSALGDLSLSAPGLLRLGGPVRAGGLLNLIATDVILDGWTVGVEGVLTKIAGDLDVGVDGALQSGTALALEVADFRNAGLVSARGSLDLTTRGDAENGGALIADGALGLDIGGTLTNLGDVRSGTDIRLGAAGRATLGGTMAARGGFELRAGSVAVSGALASEDDLALTSQGDLLVASGASLVSASGSLALDVAGTLAQHGAVQSGMALRLAAEQVVLDGDTQATGPVTVDAGTLSIQSGAEVASSADLDLKVRGDAGIAGALAAFGSVSVRAGGSLDVGGRIEAGGQAMLAAGGAASLSGTIASMGRLDLTGSAIQVGGTLLADAGATITSSEGNLGIAGTISSAGAVALSSAGSLEIDGIVRADGALSLRGTEIDLVGAAVGLAAVDVQAAGRFTTGAASLLASGDSLVVNADAIATRGSVQAGGDLSFSAVGAASLGGSAASGGGVRINAGSVTASGSLQAAGDMRVMSRDAVALGRGGSLQASGAIGIAAATDFASAGTLASGADLRIDAGATLTDRGQLFSDGGLVLAGRDLLLGGTIAADGDVRAVAGASLSVLGELSSLGGAQLTGRSVLVAPSGRVIVAGDLRLSATEVLVNQGLVAAEGAVELGYGAGFSNTGTISSGGDLRIASDIDFVSEGRLVSRGSVRIDARDVLVSGGLTGGTGVVVGGRNVTVAAEGVVQSGQDLALTASGALRIDGDLLALGAMTLSGATGIAVDGSAEAGGALKLRTGAELVSNGTLASSSSVTIAAASAALTGRLLSDGGASINVEEGLTSSGLISAAGALSLDGRNLTLGGTVVGGTVAVKGEEVSLLGELNGLGAIDLTATSGLLLAERSGIAGLGDLRLSAERLSLSGSVTVDGRVDATAGSRLDVAGTVLSQGGLALAAGNGLHVAGTLRSAGEIALRGPDTMIAGTVEGARTIDVRATRFDANGLVSAGTALDVGAADIRVGPEARLVSGGGMSLGADGSAVVDGALSAVGKLNLTAGGELTLAGTAASGADAALSGERVDLSGSLLADGGLSIMAAHAADLSGTVTATGALAIGADRIDLIAGGTVLGNGAVELRSRGGVSNAGSIGSATAVVIAAGGAIVNRGTVSSGGDAAITAGGILDAAGTLEARYRLILTAPTLAVGGTLRGGTGVAVSGQDIAFEIGAKTSSGGDLDVRAGGDLATAGAMNATGRATLSADGRLDHRATLSAGADASLAAGAALDVVGDVEAGGTLSLAGASVATTGDLLSDGGLGITSHAGDIALGGLTSSVAGVTLLSSRDLLIGGTVVTDGRLSGRARDIGIDGTAVGKTSVDIRASGAALLSDRGLLATDGALAIQAATLENMGTVSAGEGLDLTVEGQLRNGKLIVAGGAFGIGAGTFVNETDARLFGGSASRIEAGDVMLGGALFSADTLAIDTANLVVSGDVRSAGTLSASSSGRMALADGSLLASGSDVALVSGGGLDADGSIFAGGTLTLSASEVLSTDGSLQAQGDMRLDGGSLALGGVLVTDRRFEGVSLGALSLTGELQAGGDVELDGRAATFADTGLVLAGGDLVVRADRLGSTAKLGAAGDVLLTSASDLHSGGAIASGADVSLNAGGDLRQAGSLEGAGIVRLGARGRVEVGGFGVGGSGVAIDGGDVAVLAGAGWQSGAGLSLLSRGDATNTGDLLAAGSLDVSTAGDFGQQGRLFAAEDLTASAGGLLSNSGAIEAAGEASTLTLAARSLANTGSVVSSGRLGLTSGDASLGGVISGTSAASIDVAGHADVSGTLVSGGMLGMASGSLATGTGSKLLSGGDLTLRIRDGFAHAGAASSGGALNGTASRIAGAGSFESEGALTLSAGGMDLAGRLAADGFVSLTTTAEQLLISGTVLGAGTTLTSAGDLGVAPVGSVLSTGTARLRAAGDLAVDGQVTSNATLSLSAGGGASFGTTATLRTGGGLDVSAGGALAHQGKFEATGNVVLTGAAIASHDVRSDGAVTMAASGDLAITGGTDAVGPVSLGSAGGGIAVTAGSGVRSGAAITLSASRAISNVGAIVAATDLSATSGTAVASSGELAALEGTLTLNAPRLDLGGTVYGDALAFRAPLVAISGTVGSDAAFAFAGDTLAVASGGSLQSNGAISIDAGKLDVDGALVALDSLQAIGVTISIGAEGKVAANRALTLSARDVLSSAGTIWTGDRLALSAPSLRLGGTASAKGSGTVSGGAVAITGLAEAGGALSVSGGSVAVEAAGALRSGSELTIDAGRVGNAGSIEAQGAVALHAVDALINGGRVSSNASIRLTSAASADVGGTLASGGTIEVAANGIGQSGSLTANGDVSLAAGPGALSIGGAVVSTDGRASLSSDRAIAIGSAAEVFAARGLIASAPGIDNAGALLSLGSVDLRAADAVVSSGRIAAREQVTLSSSAAAPLRRIDLTGGTVDAASIGLTADAVAIGGRLRASGAVGLSASDVTVTGGVSAGGEITLTAVAGSARPDLAVLAGGELVAGGNILLGELGRLTVGGLVSSGANVTASYVDAAVSGRIEAGQDLSLTYAGSPGQLGGFSFKNNGELAAGRDLTLSGGAIASSGLLHAGNDLRIASEGYTLAAGPARSLHLGGKSIAGRDLDISVVGGLVVDGSVAVGRNAALSASSHVVAGDVAAAGSLSFTNRPELGGATTGFSLTGSVRSNGALSVVAGPGKTIEIGSTGRAISDDRVLLSAAGITSTGTLAAGDLVSLDSPGTITLGGLVQSGRRIEAEAGRDLVVLGGARLETAGNAQAISLTRDVGASANIALGAGGALSNAGTIVSDGSVALRSGASAITNTGLITGWRGVALQTENAVGNTGKIAGGGLAIFQRRDFTNVGGYSSEGDLLISAPNIGNSGLIGAGGSLALQADGSIGNGGTLFAGRDLTLSAGGSFHNDGGLALAAGSVRIAAASVLNESGTIEAMGGDVAIDTGALTNRVKALVISTDASGTDTLVANSGAAQIVGAGNVVINAGGGTVTNSNSHILAGGDVRIAAGTLNNFANWLKTTTVEPVVQAVEEARSAPGLIDCPLTAVSGSCVQTEAGAATAARTDWQELVTVEIGTQTVYRDITETKRTSITEAGATSCSADAIVGTCVIRPAVESAEAHASWRETRDVTVTRTEWESVRTGKIIDMVEDARVPCPPNAVPGSCYYRPGTMTDYTYWQEYEYETRQVTKEYVEQEEVAAEKAGATECPPTAIAGSCVLIPAGSAREASASWDEMRDVVIGTEPVEEPIYGQEARDRTSPGEIPCPTDAIEGSCRTTPAGTATEASTAWKILVDKVVGEKTVTTEAPLPTTIRAGGTVIIAAAEVNNGTITSRGGFQAGGHGRPDTSATGTSPSGDQASAGQVGRTGVAPGGAPEAAGSVAPRGAVQEGLVDVGTEDLARGGSAAAPGRGAGPLSIVGGAGLTAGGAPIVKTTVKYFMPKKPVAVTGSAKVDAGVSYRVADTGAGATSAGTSVRVSVAGPGTSNVAVAGPVSSSVGAAAANGHVGASVADSLTGGDKYQARGGVLGAFASIAFKGAVGATAGQPRTTAQPMIGKPGDIGRPGVGAASPMDMGDMQQFGGPATWKAQPTGGVKGLVLPTLSGTSGKVGSVVLDVLQRFKLVGGTGGLGFADGSSLFAFNGEADAAKLFTTKPGFATTGQLYDSDYLFNQLGRDRATHFARLGDGFFEAQLIGQQVRAATNQSYLPRFGGALEQAQGLMEAAAAQQAGLGLTLGVALTPEQVAKLTGSIVWWVQASIDGRDVLVPVVYLAAGDGKALEKGALIAGQAVAAKVEGDLRNTGAIAAGEVVSLKAGGDIVNTAGGRIAGGAVVAIAARDILNGGGSRITGTDMVLSAGRDVRLDSISGTTSSAGHDQLGRRRFTSSTSNGTTVTGSELVAGGDLVVNAGRDIDVRAGSVAAGGSAAVIAGRDLSVGGVSQTETTTEAWRTGKKRYGTQTDTQSTFVGSAVSAGGDLLLSAGDRVALTGSSLSAGGDAAIGGASVAIGAARNSASSDLSERRGKTRTTASADATTHVLSGVTAGGDLAVASPGTVKLEGANLAAGGASSVSAGMLEIKGVIDSVSADVSTRKKSSGLLSSKKTSTRTTTSDEEVVASSVSGAQVDIASTGDASVLGSNIAATGDARVAAGGALAVGGLAATDTSAQSTSVKKTGLSLSGDGLFAGVAKNRTTTSTTDVSNTGSVVGSAEGGVSLDAGKALTVTGSTVLAPGTVALTGESVAIEAAIDRTTTIGTTKSSSVGVTAAIQSPIIAGIQSAARMADAVGGSSSARTQLVGTAAGALAVKNTVDAVDAARPGINAALKGGDPLKAVGELASVSVTFGMSKSSSKTSTTGETAVGSQIAGGDVVIAAGGAGAGSTVGVVGSSIRAERDLTVAAEGAISLLSARETSTSASSNKSSGFSAGVQIGASGITPTGSLDVAKGKAQGTEVTHAGSSLSAGGTARVTTPGALVLKGATLGGGRVDVEVGSLRIESDQDTATYKSKQTAVGLSASMQGGSGSVSGNLSSSKQSGDFASVEEQSGIFAGTGGFGIKVVGATELKGAVIASEAGAEANSLSTGTLSASDIENRERFKASSLSVGGGIGDIGKDASGKAEAAKSVPGSNLPGLGGVSATAPVAMGASGKQSGATGSAIAAGDIVVTSGDAASLAAAANVGRDTAAANDGALVREFTDDKRAEIERGFAVTRELATQTATFFETRAKEEKALRDAAAKAKEAGDAAKYARLTDQADALNRSYGAGSTTRLVATAVNGAAGGNVAGGVGDLVRGAAVNVLQGLAVEQVARLADSLGRRDEQGRLLVNADGSIVQTTQSETLRGALQAVVGCAGAAAGGSGGCGSAAAGAAASVAVNLLVNALDEERRAGRGEELRYDAEGRPVNPASLEGQTARSNLVATIVAGIGAAAGFDAAAASTAAQLETQNNDLGAYQPCPPGRSGCIGEREFLAQPDVRRMIEVLGISDAQAWSCATTSNVQCAEGLNTYRHNRLSELQRTGAIDEEQAARLRTLPITQFDGEVNRLSQPQAGTDGNFLTGIGRSIAVFDQNNWQVITRGLGALQAGAGVFDIVAGGGTALVGGASCPVTGVGCVVAVGGGALVGIGADNFRHGLGTVFTGEYQPTLGARWLSELTGLTTETSETIYGFSTFGVGALQGSLRTALRSTASNAANGADAAQAATSLDGAAAQGNATSPTALDYDTVSTARPHQATLPRDLPEQVLWNRVLADPGSGTPLRLNNDRRFQATDGWQKMSVNHTLPDRSVIEIHYQYNSRTGRAYDMKIVTPQRPTIQPRPSIRR